ncbi:CerR family C-terminal domain-containing protein [Poriferisphaera sp. WC338]|uniref:CerR family C-terminal domain-containing protein n=1 Tax=Poriferisphaera sp. WC338 TaxID=3425129 RepID=UPI003D816D06
MVDKQKQIVKVRDETGEKERGDITRDKLIHVSGRLFAEKGFDGTSVRLIAKEAGVGIGVLNYHFKSKDGLYEAVLGEVLSYFGKPAFATESGYGALPNKEKLRMWVMWAVHDALMYGIDEDEGVGWYRQLLTREMLSPSEVYLKWYMGEGMQQVEVLVEIVSGMLGLGKLDERVNFCVMSLLGQVYVYYYESGAMRYVWPGVYTDSEVVDRLVTFTERIAIATIEAARESL